MADWRVWPAVDGDEEALAVLEAESFGDRSWGENSVRKSFVVPGVAILLAGEARRAPAGFVIWRDLGGEAEILSLGVAPGKQQQGVGRALVAALADAAKAVGAARIFLEVDAGNEAAIALYRRAGFTQSGRRQGYYRDGADAVLMQLIL